MNKFKYYSLVTLRFLLAIFMVNAGVQHFLKPDFYIPFVPSFLPFTQTIIFLSGIVEVALGAMLFLRKGIGKYGALGVFFLMLVFFPIHISDLFSSTPAIGSQKAAWIRFVVQFIFTAWAWAVYRFLKTNTKSNNGR